MSYGQSMAGPLVDAALADRPIRRRLVFAIVVRAFAVVAGTLLLYALVPIREETARAVLIGAVVGLVLLVVLFGRQLARISRAPHPVLAAIEALALVVTMFLALFAFLYASLSADDPGAFTQPVGKVAGIYFAVTILATVGFGDISAVTDMARIAVTVQMVLDLILIGVAVKVLGTSARRAVEARQAGAHTVEDVSDAVADRVVEALADTDRRSEG